MDAPKEKETFYLLQIFRGIASLLVIFVHASGISIKSFSTPVFNNFFEMGGSGVDFFFVLSGFLIFHLHHDQIGKPRYFLSYIKKRLIRIYPTYWLITLLIIPVYFIIPSYGQGDERNAYVIINSLLLFPMYRAPILVAGWSLCHEIFFYSIFGLLILFFNKLTAFLLILWISLLLFLSFVVFFYQPFFENPWVQIAFWPQNLEFLLGCFSGFLIAKYKKKLTRNFSFFILISFCLLFLFWELFFGSPGPMGSGSRVLVYGTLSFGIVVSSVRIDQTTNHTPKTGNTNPIKALLYFLGAASYSIYLTHGPSLSLLFKTFALFKINDLIPANWIFLIISILSILIGCLFYLFIESRIIKIFKKSIKS